MTELNFVSNEGTIAREAEFWDGHAPSLQECQRWFESGCDGNLRHLLDRFAPWDGKRVLDFACGACVLSAFLAARGASVTAIDVSPASIQRGRELAALNDLDIEFICAPLTSDTFASETFDVVTGRWALHHVDLHEIAPILGSILRPGGVLACEESMGLNPILRFARNHLAGVGPIAKLGTEDERPLGQQELDQIAHSVGPVELVVAELWFLSLLDRNVLHDRFARASRLIRRVDRQLLKLGLQRWSYDQIVVARKPLV